MRELAIGDIHGCARAFKVLLDAIKPTSDDTIILLGDYIDRGPDSCGVIDLILELNRKCTVVPLAGNHEKMLLGAHSESDRVAEWLKQGGEATLNSYLLHGFASEIHAIPREHWRFFSEQLLDYWETDNSIYVHATIDPGLDLSEQPDYLLFWQYFSDPTAHKSGKRIICGHTSQKSGWPAVFDQGTCIDTWAHGGGWLTCFDASHDCFIQANESGAHRSFDLQMLSERGGEAGM
jgi:serine/threonine protein phosphatase 1